MWLLFPLLAFCLSAARAEFELAAPPHRYYERALNDRFTRLKSSFETGQVKLDRGDEKRFLTSLLEALEIPASSQMLVFSTTSLQLSLISPSNPRALYFNEDTYLGYVPGGRIEILSLDPELGGIFYIFDIPRAEAPLNIERSTRCMNCHAGSETGYVPGLVIKSVIPGARGGSLDAFRTESIGHGVALSERFGGWYLTGANRFTSSWANAIGRPIGNDQIARQPVRPGERFSFSRYPAATSDLLPQLVHEHQAGFVNRVLQAAYLARELESPTAHRTGFETARLQPAARDLVRYLLFADEAPLPAGGIDGDPAFKRDFLRSRRPAGNGASLKDFELTTRLFRYRCSYMIYAPVFTALPRELKTEIFEMLRRALGGQDSDFSYLPEDERRVIDQILRETLPDFSSAP